MQRLPALAHFVVLLGLGIVCLPLFLMLMPYVEASPTEARLLQAYMQVHQLRDEHRNLRLEASASDALATPDAATGSTIRLPQTDPWGQHYRLVSLGGSHTGQFRVYSSGPNMSSPSSGVDHDDIYSDMPVSPLAAIYARKKRQWLIALSATALAWSALSLLYLRIQLSRAN